MNMWALSAAIQQTYTQQQNCKPRQMSRCQHGQPITQFCINDTCNWRELSGCDQCFKKYHNHLQPIDTLSIDKLEQMYKLYNLKNQIKPKSRILQEAVYNYFIIMKSQISASIDAVSRVITNRLNYPYLNEEGQLNAYKKIKNKEYKKITKKELKNFYNFTNTQNKDIIELNEKKLYKEEVLELSTIMKNINDSFVAYSKAVQKLDNTFNVERSFLNKIYEIANTIQKADSKSFERISTQSQHSSNSQFGEQKSNKDSKQLKYSNTIPNPNFQPPVTIKQSRDRKVSLDFGLTGGIDTNKFKVPPGQSSNNSNIDQNQKQIYERKKRLFDMINNPNQTSVQNTIASQLGGEEKKHSNPISKSIQKNIPNLTSIENTPLKKQALQVHAHTHTQQQKQIPDPIYEHQDEHMINSKASCKESSPTVVSPPRIHSEQENSREDKEAVQKQDTQIQTRQDISENNELDKQKASLFEDLMSKGINLPQMIVHTILPRQTSRPKLYEDTRDVKQRKITIPVKKFDERELDGENSSPLFKRKRQKILEKQRQAEREDTNGSDKDMGRISLFADKLEPDHIKQDSIERDSKNKSIYETPKKEKQDDKLYLKDRQADSLALLVQSLPLSAEKAIPLLEASIKYAHNNLSAAEYLSYLYLLIEKPKQCLELCNKFLQQLQDSPEANELSIHLSNNKAAALNMLGRYSQSIGILEKCLNFTKRDIYYKNLADAYFSIAIYEKAILNYENAIKMNSQMDEALYNLAVCYYIQEHMHEAKLNVSKALKINPKNQEYLRLSREIMIRMQS